MAEVYSRTLSGRITWLEMTRDEVEFSVSRWPWRWSTSPRGFAPWPAALVRGEPIEPPSIVDTMGKWPSLDQAEMRAAIVAGLLTFVAVIIIALAGIAMSASGALALTLPTSSAGPGQYAVSIASVTALTVPQFAAVAEICVETAVARYTDDGTTPSATNGIPVAVGQCFAYGGPLAVFRIIGAGATLDVSYSK